VTILNDVTPAGIVFNANNSGNYTLADGGGAVIFAGTPTIAANGDATISASIQGTGFTKTGLGTLTLSGTNVYLGTTTISNGTLLVNGVLTTNLASTVAAATNGTLGGLGWINGAAVVQDGGTLAPGSGGIGQLTFGNDVSLSGLAEVVMELSKDGGTLTNDLALISGTFTQGGTLLVTNLGTDALSFGDSVTLFVAGTHAGGFATLVLPALTNSLSWNTSALATNGTLNVVWTDYTLTYSSGSNGTLTGASPQTVNFITSGSAVMAVANSGYAFTNWSDGSTANPRTDAGVTNNVNVIANFVAVNLTPPAITNFNLASSQAAFTLTGSGVAGQMYVLLSATNLPPLFWTPVATNTADANGVFQFTDTETTNYARRFYRVMTY
jgi:autotransporter-associated beta strand protein